MFSRCRRKFAGQIAATAQNSYLHTTKECNLRDAIIKFALSRLSINVNVVGMLKSRDSFGITH